MPKLLQINVTANRGSTGKIAEQIGLLAKQKGWESFIVYGRDSSHSKNELIKVGSMFNTYEHYIENRLWDNEGLASRFATKRLIKKIKEVSPDIIHLHNIHDHYINYSILFEFFYKLDIPIVWTVHDCWAFTGGCAYYVMADCSKWLMECNCCPQKRSILFDRSRFQFNQKKVCFSKLKNLTLVPVSKWLAGEVSRSFLKNHTIYPIYNGIDVTIFKPIKSSLVRIKYKLGNNTFVMGVASVWDKRKNLDDYIRLSQMMGDVTIVLIGLSRKQLYTLPKNVIGIPCTQNLDELAELYTEALAVLNLSYEESFGLTTVEGMACGTPVIIYNSTASPELVTPETGIIVEPGNITGIINAIKTIVANGKNYYSKACRDRAVKYYNKDERFKEYVTLYENLINKNACP